MTFLIYIFHRQGFDDIGVDNVISRKKEVKDYCAKYFGGIEPQIIFNSSGPHHLPNFEAIISVQNFLGFYFFG